MRKIGERYLTETEVSELTGIALGTLRNHRSLVKGIPYIKLEKSVRYALQDVINYMESHKVHPYGLDERRCA
jgi:hypothetical protein